MGDKGGKKDKAKSAKQAKIKKDAKNLNNTFDVCGTFTKDCGTCPAAFKQQEKIWDETDPIIERMTNG